MNRTLLCMCMCWATLACHTSPDEPASEPRADEPGAVESGGVPADVETLGALLKARHADDLPSPEQLAKYPSAEASLRYLGEHGDTMVVRTRALALLRHFDSAASGDLLATIASDAASHPALRAAAVTGLAGQALADQPERLAIVVAALHDADQRVGLAAVQVLDEFPAGREALSAAKADADLPTAVRDAIQSK
jgi:hypothetical protein